jgi:hypothetical protein
VGGRREARLASGRSIRGSSHASSGPDSSSDDGECPRRAGGSLSPGAIVRVGGGGSLPLPRGLRSDVKSVGEGVPMFMLWRIGREGGRDIISGVSSGVVRREGRGGGVLSVGVELDEESRLGWELPLLLLLPFRRGGGGGGTVRLGREGGLSFDGDKKLSMPSPELLSEYDRVWLRLGVRDGIASGNDVSEISDSSSENGLCLEEEWERLKGSSESSPSPKRAERRWGGGGGG